MPRKLKSQDGNPYDIIRGMWEGAYVSHFLRLFEKKFGFTCLATQDLEEALIDDDSVVLADIIARLLRYVTDNSDILIANFDVFLKTILIQEKEVSRLIENNTTWQDLTPEEKLGVLKWLVDHVYQEKEEDIVDYLDENYSPDDLRGICVGQDAFNNVYWYLDDLRLYREFSHKKQSKKDWECVCLTLSDWHSFIKQFRKTSNIQEKELYSYLNFELFPFVEAELFNKNNKVKKSKEEKNDFLINEECKDLKVMQEKKVYLDCNNSSAESATLSPEKQNGTSAPVDSSESSVSEIIVKAKENSNSFDMNFCDGDLSINDNICSISNNLSSSVMDIKTSTVINMCTSSCTSTCSSSHDVSTITSNGNSNSYGQESNCSISLSTASTIITPREVVQEVNLQQSLSDIPSDSSSVTSNKENAPPSSSNIGSDIPPMSAISSMVGSTPTPTTTASIQPLPSNMVNKTSYQMETQYMQQQSQIFVFSTALANKAAESYLSGNFPSIIAFHCAQPGTKSFLEKYPLKVQQFNRQNPAAWLNSLAQMKQPGGRQMKTTFSGSHTVNRFPGPLGGGIGINCTGACSMHSPGICASLRTSSPWGNNCNAPGIVPPVANDICSQSWPSSQMGIGISSSSINQRYPGSVHGMNPRQMGPSGNSMMGCMGNINANSSATSFPNSGLSSLHMSAVPGCPSLLTGVKVPDENLTPQQRQHREEQLAMIRKMQQLLFPEQQQIDQGGMGSNMLSMMAGMQNQHTSQPRFPLGETCVHSGIDGCFSPHQQCVNEAERSHMPSDMYTEPQMVGSGFLQQNYPPVSVSAQLEWQKLQHQFYEERRKKEICSNTSITDSFTETQTQNQTTVQQQISQSQSQRSTPQPLTPQQQQGINSPSPSMGLSPGTRMQGPPPPYHQTNKRTMPSPHPASPNTSSLSLPSPLAVSGLPSPADTSSRQFPVPTPPGPKLSHHSPGSTTPAGSNSLHTTPLNSPKPSGSGSNITHIRTPTTPSNTNSTPCGTPTSSYAPILPSSSPATPISSSASSFKQGQSCAADLQDSNSLDIVTSTSSEFPSSISVSSSNNVQGELFCHDMHSCNQSSQKQDQGISHSGVCQKEPSLMPVPSPQQIQYLNSFDRQELTIQKQPNTGIRELDAMSPQSVTPSMVMSGGSQSQFQSPDATSFPNTPGSCPSTLENSQDSLAGRCPSSAPASMESGISRFHAPSPQIPGFEPGPRHAIQSSQMIDNSTQRFPAVQNMEMVKNPGAHTVSQIPLSENDNRFPASGSQNSSVCPGLNVNNNLSRFPCNGSDAMQRFRGPSPHINMDMGHSRFLGINSHIRCTDTFTQSSQFSSMGSEGMTPNQAQTFSASVPSMTSQSSPCLGSSFIDSNVPHSHLQNLQKMTPPFENVTGNKMSSDVISPVAQCSNTSVNSSSMTAPQYGGTSPLSPSHVSPSQRLTHFDPIASMAAMSESTVPMASCAGSTQTHQNVITSNMSMTNMQISSNVENNNPSNVSFHGNVQSMQNIPSSISCSISNQNQFSVHNQIGHTGGCINQSVNITYASTAMSIHQLNGQNIVTSASYTTCGQGPNVNPHSVHPNCLGSGANTLSCSVTTNHPIMHTSVTTRTSNANIMVPGARHAPTNFPIQRSAPPPSAGSPSLIARGSHFNRTNIQVKASAPNTIQYLPARQQCTAPSSNRPPTLEFLQRFVAPLANLDSKVPTHNLQYFPNTGGTNPHSVHNNIGVNPGSGTVTSSMLGNQRPVNMIMEPIMRRANSNVSHPSGQIFSVGSGVPNAESPMFGRPPCPSINNQMIPMNSMSIGQGTAMFPNKQMPLSVGGMAPEATQPLPPSMGQSFNYKQSPFYGPTTADPNYAVQFHNFQQQLYATNTRGSQINSQTNMSGQGFFGPK